MSKPLNLDWHAVRVLAVAVDVREAAREMGISEDAVRQPSKREGWMASAKAAAQRALAKHVTEVSPSALSPADALASALSDDSRETKLGLSAAARNAEGLCTNARRESDRQGAAVASRHGQFKPGARLGTTTARRGDPQPERPLCGQNSAA
jgi:hypothetical protein